MKRLGVGAVIASSIMLFATPATAQELSGVDALLQQMDEAAEQITATSCEVACAALQSMIRSADEVCALDPGPPCQQARSKVEAARAKVRARCPDCAAAKGGAAAIKPKPPAPDPSPGTTTLPEPAGGDAEPAMPSPVPPAAPTDDGCATCTVGAPSSDFDARWLLAALALAGMRRRLKPS